MMLHVNAAINANHIHADVAQYANVQFAFAALYAIAVHALAVREELYVVHHADHADHVVHQGELYAIHHVIFIANCEY